MSVPNVVIMLLLASLATIWTVWPEKYQRWVDGLFAVGAQQHKLLGERVRSVFPFSMTTKPWYPTYLRMVGVFIWLVLLGMAYLFYRP